MPHLSIGVSFSTATLRKPVVAAAGIVHQVGEGVADLQVGDKVEAAAVGIAYLAAYESVYPPYGRLAKMPALERAEVMRKYVLDVPPLLHSGAIVPVVDRVFSFDELPAAKAYVESDSHVGKVVIRICD